MVAAKSSRVNRQYKTKYRIRNWREYERGLRSRGDVTIWLSEDAIAAWVPPKNGLRGGQRRYSNLAVRTALTLRVVFSLPLRKTFYLKHLLAAPDVLAYIFTPICSVPSLRGSRCFTICIGLSGVERLLFLPETHARVFPENVQRSTTW